MHLNSIGPWIWVIVVAIGIVNSIRKKAAAGARPVSAQSAADQSAAAAEAELRKQAYFDMINQQRQAAANAPAARVPIPAPVAAQSTGAIARAAAAAIPVAAARPAPPPRVEAPVAPAPPAGPDAFAQHPSLVRRRTGGFAGIFEHRKGILRGIVAAEVLGKPKALAEQPFWSQPPTGRSTSHS